MPALTIPNEIKLLLLEYLEYEDKIEVLSCCKEWYQKLMQHSRYLKLRNDTEIPFQDLIADPFRQLSLSDELLDFEQVVSVLSQVDYCLHELECGDTNFIKIMSSIDCLKVRKLFIIMRYGDEEDEEEDYDVNYLFDGLSKVLDCRSLSLHLVRDLEEFDLPYFPQLRELELSGEYLLFPVPSLSLYCSTLQSLTLEDCNITDVSMFGSIPQLRFCGCLDIIDISPLQYNDQVEMHCCESITDYSQSFEHSRKIDITLIRGPKRCTFDLSLWKRVNQLRLKTFRDTSIRLVHNHRQLPKTVKQCTLEGPFVAAIDFTVTTTHMLTDLKLENEGTIESLEGYGFERLTVIACEGLTALQTLQGFGRGKNRKVIIRNCHKIRDFSPINHLPKVEIHECKGFMNPLQVRMVSDLIITPAQNIKFHFEHLFPTLHRPFATMNSLTLLQIEKRMTDLTGIEEIPQLQFDAHCAKLLKGFLESGKQFHNQRMVVTFYRTVERMNPSSSVFRKLHHRYLKDDYDYDHQEREPERWIWRRKE